MKNLFLGMTMVLISSITAVAQEYMDVIMDKTCNCVETLSDTLALEQYNMQLGLCMLEAAEPFRKEIKKEYDIDFNNIENEGEDLGRIIGMKMVSYCPDALMKLTERQGVGTEQQEESSTLIDYGVVEDISTDSFAVLKMTNTDGKHSKYYWLEFVKGAGDLAENFQNLKGKELAISYEFRELFDPKIGEYRAFKVIQSISVLN